MKTATFQVTFRTDNAAFDEGSFADEVARILRALAANVERGQYGGTVFDINGNKVGHYGQFVTRETTR